LLRSGWKFWNQYFLQLPNVTNSGVDSTRPRDDVGVVGVLQGPKKGAVITGREVVGPSVKKLSCRLPV
jgi:hypothetical protein